MITGTVLGQARHLIHEHRQEALDGVVSDTVGQPKAERLAALTEAERAWQPAIVGYEGTRLALEAWIDSIALASAAGAEEDVLAHVAEMVGRLLLNWDPLALSLQALGVDLPTLPVAMRDLAFAVAEDRDVD